MKTTVPILICTLMAVLIMQRDVPASNDNSLESRVQELEKKVATLQDQVKWNKDQITKYHNLQVKSMDAVKWSKLSKGMLENEVIMLLGKPNSRASARGSSRLVYRYGENTGYVVIRDGMVDSWREPKWD